MAVNRSLLIAAIFFSGAVRVFAQAPPGSSAEDPGRGQDPLAGLVTAAGALAPRLERAVEGPLVSTVEGLAFWAAAVVMLFSFARLLRENDGAGRDLFWWMLRLGIVFTLFGASREILDAAARLGQEIVALTEVRRALWGAAVDFNANYEKFTEGLFLVKPSATDPDKLIGALTSGQGGPRSLTEMLDPSSWNLANVFAGVTLARFALEFAQLFLALLSPLITVALRLFAPFAVAFAVDRGLAQRVSYPFAWGAAVFTLVTPLVSAVLSLAVYTAGGMAFAAIAPGSGLFTVDSSGAVVSDPARITETVYACVVLGVLMLLGALLLLASPFISHRIASGQVYEAVSATASGWLGAISATGIELAGVSHGGALWRQAQEARLEGHYLAEAERARASFEAGGLQARAQRLLGLQSAAASRTQALGSIEGGFAASAQSAEAQRQASRSLIEQGRLQQERTILADRGFGQRQTALSLGREERDLRLSQGERNMLNLIGRAHDLPDAAAHGLSRLGGEAMPLLPALSDATRMVTGPSRGLREMQAVAVTTDARVESLATAKRGFVENQETYAARRIGATDAYAAGAGGATDRQAAAQVAAARAHRDLASAGVEGAYRQQVSGTGEAYRLQLGANHAQLAGALKAASIMRASGERAARLEQVSQAVTVIARDLARRAEQSMAIRY